MRREGHFIDSGANAYTAGQMQQMSSQRMDHNSQFQGQLEAFTPEREQPYANSKGEGQWSYGSKMLKPMGSPMFNEGQGIDASGSYYQGQRDMKASIEKQNSDPRNHPHEQNMTVSYEDNRLPHTFEGLEQKFLDDILKLVKEQNEAEDAENIRHREKINVLNSQYQDQLAALRARHSSRRDEFLRKESHARQQKYQQAVMNHTGTPPAETMPPGFSNVAAAAAAGDPPRPYSSDRFDHYGERSRFPGNSRDHGFEPRGPYPGGRPYDTGSRYY